MKEESQSNNLRTLYDFSESYMRYDVAIYPFIFTIVGIILIIYAYKTSSPNNNTLKEVIFGLVFFVFSLFLVFNIPDYRRTQYLLKSNNYKVVQDSIKNYKIKFYAKSHCDIAFDIGNIHFNTDNYNDMNYGCTSNDIKDRGFKNGDYLRVLYINTYSGNKILKIQKE